MFPEAQSFCLPQSIIPPCMNFALKHESEYESGPWNFTEEAANYLKYIQSLSEVKKIETRDYLAILKICLYLEQFEINKEIKRYSLKNGKLKKSKSNSEHCFIIDVPSLTSEQSVIVLNDKVSLYHVVSKRNILARVVKLSKNEVTIQLDASVDAELFNNNNFDISFVSQYWPLRCCHYAITAISMRNWIPLIYPEVGIPGEDVEFDIEWVNPNVAKNEQQKQAVKKILNKTAHPAPYIIFGPPGTGKTATLVETICQIIRQHPTENILVCTTSNAAADEITTRLIGKVPKNILCRIYAPSRSREKVDKLIQPYATFADGKTISLTMELLCKKIIITTLVTSLSHSTRSLFA
nr:PREDICTED: putative helicase MOV-10 isoform X1 [Linepithema humile]